jgi:hypothetical protein
VLKSLEKSPVRGLDVKSGLGLGKLNSRLTNEYLRYATNDKND